MASIWVRATINMQGINRDQLRAVNPDSTWVKENLAAGFLIRVNADGVDIPEPPAPVVAPVEASTDVGNAEAIEAPVAAIEPAEDRAPDIPAAEGPSTDEAETDAVAP